MKIEITGDPKQIVTLHCPVCRGTQKFKPPGTWKEINCPACEGDGEVAMFRGQAEKDQHFFAALFNGDI